MHTTTTTRSFPTYAKARQAIANQFPGKRFRVQGAITLYAEHHGAMVPVTNIKADMDHRARAYRAQGRAYEYRIATNLGVRKVAA